MAEEAKPEETKPTEDVEVKLTKPINSFGDEIAVIKFRRPTAADIIRIGNPVQFDPISDPPRIEHHPQRMTQMMTRLSGVPSSSLEHLTPQDWVTAAWAITPFFLPTPGT